MFVFIITCYTRRIVLLIQIVVNPVHFNIMRPSHAVAKEEGEE